MITITLFTRTSCPDCDHARADLESLQSLTPHRLVVINVDEDPVLRHSYKDVTPMAQIGPYTLRWPFTKTDLQVAVSAAQDRSQKLDAAGDEIFRGRVERGQTVTGTDRFSYWLSAHYMVLFNLVALLYVGLPMLAPVFMKVGATMPARVIYGIYSPLCHQLAFRSFFLFGEQPYYPRELAGMRGVLSYEQIANDPTVDLG
ncbi:MAG TPA: glutaredoxin family protein, partial [Anaerolineaceae bacterium]|nr:glutaredoxin family protein [Anaerolineaceae bacterium]